MSLNPVQFGKTVIDQYGRYLLTNFPMADPDMAVQFQNALRHAVGDAPLLYRGPYVYLNQPFAQGPGINDLIADPDLGLHPAMRGIFPFATLHKHQELALRAAQAGQHVILATGTGSGKTEAFLLPIVEHCLRLRDKGAPPGVAAILVYPMNALVNDQLDRLRKMLAGTRITFGRYTGETPNQKGDNVAQLDQPRGYTADELQAADELNAPLPLPWEECYDRQSIRQRQPRILLTNYFQLEYMLLRDSDLTLFQQPPLRYLVLDEVHTYTGELGSEVACLLRRLRAVSGKGVDDLICIGTSATVRDDGDVDADSATLEFAHRLFGVPQAKVRLVKEHYLTPAEPAGTYLPPLPANMGDLLDRILTTAAAIHRRDEIGELPAELVTLTAGLCHQTPTTAAQSTNQQLYALLGHNRIPLLLNRIFDQPKTWDEALILYRRWAEREEAADEELIAEMLAYLTLGAMAERDGEPLLRPKLHYFIQGLSGLQITFEGAGVKQIHFDTETAELHSEALALPLRLCRSCGQHFTWLVAGDMLAAQAEGVNKGYQLTRIPARFEDPEEGLVYLTDVLHTEDEEAETAVVETSIFCRFCGTLHPEPTNSCLNPKCGRRDGLLNLHIFHGQLRHCPACGAPSSKGGNTPGIRDTQSSEVADITILSQSMLAAMEEPALRKLLIFADNRQDAAFQAGWMEERAKRFRLRHLLYTILHRSQDATAAPHPLGYARLVDNLLELAQEEQILKTSHWDDEENQTRVRWFLLEEFASTSQRRTSLEQLGLASVRYAGLTADADPDWWQKWATLFGLQPEELVNVVHLLLDYYRRRGLLSDALLARYWSYQDKEYRQGWVQTADFYRPKALVQVKGDKGGFVMSWLASNGRSGAQTIVDKAVRQHGERRDEFLEALWLWLRQQEFIVPVDLLQKRYGKAQTIDLGAEGFHVNTHKVGFVETTTRYLCGRCQKSQAVSSPTGLCPEYNCKGTLLPAGRDEDHYDVVQYTRLSFVPMRAAEHSAQVPKEKRERAEREFKKENGAVNTIVATPTLEMGVDIGKLEMTMMRNVPPTPANYAQRSGRAGRRHRIAAVFTYCRGHNHDRYFFERPPEMIAGAIRIPAFSMQNEPLIRKHVHAAALTALRRWANDEEKEVLNETFPPFVWAYFAAEVDDGQGQKRLRYLDRPRHFPRFADLLARYRDRLLDWLRAIFAQTWPEADAFAVAPAELARYLDEMTGRLQSHTTRLFREIQAYNQMLANLRQREDENLGLTTEEKRRRRQYEAARQARERQDIGNYSLSYLANDGFLPGYALARESVTAVCLDPLVELSRPAATALRELTPANQIYANKNVFGVQTLNFTRLRVQDSDFSPQQIMRQLRFNPETERIYDPAEAATEQAAAADTEFTSLQLTDVELSHMQEIDDRQNTRRRVAFNLYGMLLGTHAGGQQGRVNDVQYRYLKKAAVRLVNCGPARPGPASPGYGFPICPQTGEMRSPFASTEEIDRFRQSRLEKLNTDILWAALHVEIPSDVLLLGPFAEVGEAANLSEAVRIGARQVLDMGAVEIESFLMADESGLEWVVFYDPLPGGSGFLPQILRHWSTICEQGQHVLGGCQCPQACYNCMLHFRNQQWHAHLDRHAAMSLLEAVTAYPHPDHAIAPMVKEEAPAYTASDSEAEDAFVALLSQRHFPLPSHNQYRVALGSGAVTIADYAYEAERVLVFVDGMSPNLHGNPIQQRQDRIQRAKAKMQGYRVVELTAQELKDETAVGIKLDELALYLGREDLLG